MKNSIISGVFAVLIGCLATAGGAQGRGVMLQISSFQVCLPRMTT